MPMLMLLPVPGQKASCSASRLLMAASELFAAAKSRLVIFSKDGGVSPTAADLAVVDNARVANALLDRQLTHHCTTRSTPCTSCSPSSWLLVIAEKYALTITFVVRSLLSRPRCGSTSL